MHDDVLLDFDINNIPVALEILDATKKINVSKQYLNKINSFNLEVEVTEEIIRINALFGFVIHNKKNSHELNSLIDNYSHIPNLNAKLIA